MQIAIASGKGGAGKTCVTASLAAVWDGPLVAVDADVEAPNLHLFLRPQLTEERTAWLDVPQLSPEKCLHCDKCRDICSYKAIASFVGRISIFPDMCHGCNGCFAVCPSGALTRGRRELGRILNGCLRYTILPIQQVVEEHHQRQLAELELSTERQRRTCSWMRLPA